MIRSADRRPRGRIVSEAVAHAGRWLAWHAGRPRVKPRQVIVDLTDRCFFRCPTCAKWLADRTTGELATADWLEAFARLRDWLGPFHLSLSGGEPLLRDDLYDLIAFAGDHQITTNLMTNGWLVDAETARRLVASGLTNLTFSLNALSPELHDRTRGMPGSHARILAGIEHARRARDAAGARMTISLNTIVAGATASELPALLRWARSAGIDAVGLQPLVDVSMYRPYRSPRPAHGPEWAAMTDLRAGDPQQIEAVMETLVTLKEQGYPVLGTSRQLRLIGAYLRDPAAQPGTRCFAGVNDFLIDPYGGVRLCYSLEPIGDIRASAPRDLWWSSAAARVRAQVRRCRQGCRLLNCNYQASAAERLDALWHAPR